MVNPRDIAGERRRRTRSGSQALMTEGGRQANYRATNFTILHTILILLKKTRKRTSIVWDGQNRDLFLMCIMSMMFSLLLPVLLFDLRNDVHTRFTVLTFFVYLVVFCCCCFFTLYLLPFVLQEQDGVLIYPIRNYPLHHTAYDTMHLATMMDPNFAVSAAVAAIVAELTRDIADSLFLPLKSQDYAVDIMTHLQVSLEKATSKFNTSVC